MKSPSIKGLLPVLVLGIAMTGAPATLAFGAVPSASPQQTRPNVPPEAGPNRPASVPDGYVITPFGFFHPSCVQSLAKGERLMPDGRVQHANGNVEEAAAVCSYPHYTHGGTPVGAASNAVPLEESTPSPINGWVENANIATGSAGKTYGALIATWTVPSQPLADQGQVLYYFPGLEDINNTESILQPVLGWYGGQWTIASWNCCLNGIATSSPAVTVKTGDEIYGSVTSTCSPGALTCPTWNVLTLDMATGKSTALNNTPSDGQAFNWAFGGVLEAYYTKTCGDYPQDGRVSFENTVLFDQGLNPVVRPEWSTTTDSTDSPQCKYAVKASAHAVTLDY